MRGPTVNNRFLLMPMILFLTTILAFGGCDATNYKSVSKKSEYGSFSFRYPASFEDDMNRGDNQSASMAHRVEPGNLSKGADEFIMASMNRSYETSQQIADGFLQTDREIADLLKFQLLSRSRVYIPDFTGYVIRYWATGGPPFATQIIDPRRWFYQEVYLDIRKGVMMTMGLYALEELTDEAKPQFDIMLRTLRVQR